MLIIFVNVNLKIIKMKNLISMITVLFIGLTVTAQTALNKTVSASNVEQIAVYGTSGSNVYYSTASNFMNYGCGEDTTALSSSSTNDIFEDIAVGNDTLSINEASSTLYYGINNMVTDGTYSHNMNNFVKGIASDGTSVYSIIKVGTYYNVIQMQGATTNYFGSNFTAPELADYTDIDYFMLGGIEYLSIVHSGGLSLYDITNGAYFYTYEFTTSSVTVADGVVYFSKGNEIYEITSITADTNPIFKMITSTAVYSIDASQTINEFAFDIWGDNINVAATDGVYSECTSTVNVEEFDAFGEATLYPNPNNGNFTINNLDPGTNVNVLNPTGQLVYSEVSNNYNTDISLDVSLPNGIYFVQLSNSSSQRTIKFIKQ
jgi:hypothetical protein